MLNYLQFQKEQTLSRIEFPSLKSLFGLKLIYSLRGFRERRKLKILSENSRESGSFLNIKRCLGAGSGHAEPQVEDSQGLVDVWGWGVVSSWMPESMKWPAPSKMLSMPEAVKRERWTGKRGGALTGEGAAGTQAFTADSLT